MRFRALLVVAAGVLLAGCAGVRASPVTFQSRANAICARMNAAPYLDTRRRYEADLRKTKASLHALAGLDPSRPDRRAYAHLLAHLRRIYTFDMAHEDSAIAFAVEGKRQDRRLLKGLKPRWPVAQKRFAALISRAVGPDYSKAFTEARTLGLTACNDVSTVGTAQGRSG